MSNQAKIVKLAKEGKTKGARTMRAILKGKAVESIAKEVKTTVAAVYWYRSKLNRLGFAVPGVKAQDLERAQRETAGRPSFFQQNNRSNQK